MTQTTETPKKKSIKYWLIGCLVLVFIITGIAGIGFAQKFKHFHHDGPLGFMLEEVTKDLDLNEQQKADVQKVKDEIKAKMESRKKNREDRFAEFENLFKSDKLEKQSLNEMYQKHEADRQEMKEFFMDEMIKFHDILTPSQRVKTVEKMKEMKEKFKKGRHGFPPENN